MSCIEKACRILEQNNYTCVFCKGDIVLTDMRRGVKPLLDLLEQGTDVSGFSVADKVVGKAAAYLYCLLHVNALYAGVISEPALAVLQQHRIAASYGQLVSAIQNRTQTGPCPMEDAVWDIKTPDEALPAIYKRLKELNQS